MLVVVVPVTVRFVGIDGACVSCAMPVTGPAAADSFPALSYAVTRYVWLLPVTRPESL
jgi:hypothetical protein